MRYALVAAVLPAGPAGQAALGAPEAGTHGPYGMAADRCALCHRSHAAQGPSSLLVRGLPQAPLCFQCHDTAGTGANTRVQAQYADPFVPANSPATGSYYRHDALAPDSGHTLAEEDEFGGVSNRHNECGDCHNPHTASAEASVQTAAGWTAPGQLTYVSGVSVVNGAARTAPTYAWLDGAQAKVTYEYEVCLKCHSGWTVLPAKDPLHPSWWAEDKGVELNPANGSVHPIEAPGKNTTDAMANSLAGTSPYKLWSFTTDSTIRCVNCHGDYRKFNPVTPPAADSDLAPHANAYRGNLMQNYRDRNLKPFTEPYQSGDFALCYMCHAEAPFADGSGSIRADTNFRYHGLHLGGIRNRGNLDGDIDTPGAGRGNAVCADCHFRIHSTAFAGDFRTSPPQSGTDAGLVNFAPTVTGNVGYVAWDRSGTKTGTCTLTCHGYSHEDASY
jgi:predicted CXXCH cytochrome family protein